MTSNDKLKQRKVPSVLCFFRPIKYTEYELYANHSLILYFPLIKELDFISSAPPSYINKLWGPGVVEIVNENRNKIEPYIQSVDEELIQHNMNVLSQENQSIDFEGSEAIDSRKITRQAPPPKKKKYIAATNH